MGAVYFHLRDVIGQDAGPRVCYFSRHSDPGTTLNIIREKSLSIPAVTMSPIFIGPTPAGVPSHYKKTQPVKIKSPCSIRMMEDIL